MKYGTILMFGDEVLDKKPETVQGDFKDIFKYALSLLEGITYFHERPQDGRIIFQYQETTLILYPV